MEFDIVDDENPEVAEPYDLTDGLAVLTYWQGDATAVKLPCTIATTTATAAFTHAGHKAHARRTSIPADLQKLSRQAGDDSGRKDCRALC
jgi:hypothetical protein